ncbi:hypothetical protein M899_3350 [Bacteriovorax sp. BSW11_IV]|nr:hypothetical protein M899_3350 [Bacteriovorax sp. BSW11_IV]
MGMKKLVPILCLATSINVFAVNSSNFIEIDISKMDYKLPEKGSGDAGILNFRQVNLSWDGMNIGINNSNKIFDSKIFFRPRFIGFAGEHLNLGFQLEEENALKTINTLNIQESKFLINPQFFSFNGKEFAMTDASMKLKLKKFNLYCGGSAKYDLTTADGIIAGCLMESLINAQEENSLSAAEVEYYSVSETGDMNLVSKLNNIELSPAQIIADTTRNTIDIPGYKIDTGAAKVACAKDPELKELNSEKMTKDCLGDLEVVARKIVFNDEKEETKFFIDLEKLQIKDERLIFKTPSTQIADKESVTTLFDTKVACMKSFDSDLFDMQQVLAECFKDGNLAISKIASNDDGKKYLDLYEGIFENDLNPGQRQRSSDADVKNISVGFKNNKVFLSADVKVLIKNFTITVQADVEHHPKDNTIIFHVTKTRLPFGIGWRKLLMYFLKKNLVGSFITYEGNSIIIKM